MTARRRLTYSTPRRTPRYSPYPRSRGMNSASTIAKPTTPRNAPTLTLTQPKKPKFKPKSPIYNGTFKAVQWRKGRITPAKRRWGKFVGKVRTAVNTDANKAHFLVHRTTRIDSEINRCGWSQIVYNSNIDLREARRRCLFNTNSPGNYDLEKLRVLNTVVDISVTNPTNVCTYCDVYEVVPVNNQVSAVGQTPLDWLIATENTVDNVSQGTSAQAFNGLVGQVGANLYHIPTFWNKWRALKRTRMLLQPGECSTKQIRLSKDWVWNPQSQSAGGSETGTVFNPHTRFILYQIWGQPYNNSNPAFKDQIAYAPTALNVAYSVDYTVSQLPSRAVVNGSAVNSNVWVSQSLPDIQATGAFVDTMASIVTSVLEA